MKTVGDLLIEFKDRPRKGEELPVLTLTERNGFVRQADRFNKRLATEDTSNYKVVRRHDVAFNPYLLWAGAVAQNTIVDEGIISPLYPTFRIRDGHDPRYVARLLLSPQLIGDYEGIAFGSVPRRRRSSVEDFLNLPLMNLPLLPEQRRIAAILDQADAISAKRRQVLTHLDSLTQSIFNDMFPARSFDDIALNDFVKWSSGKFLPAKDQNGGPHPVYGGNGINGSHDEYMFEEPCLVVGRVGAYCGAVHITQPFSWVTDNALIAILLRDDLTMEYLLPALTIADLNQYAGTSGQPSISGGKIGSVRIPVPPVELQRTYAALVKQASITRQTVVRAISTDGEIFASLQSRAFRGEL